MRAVSWNPLGWLATLSLDAPTWCSSVISMTTTSMTTMTMMTTMTTTVTMTTASTTIAEPHPARVASWLPANTPPR
jgi:hypothetical protein